MNFLGLKKRKYSLLILAVPPILMAFSSQDSAIVKAEDKVILESNAIETKNDNKKLSLVETLKTEDISVEIEKENDTYILLGDYVPDRELVVLINDDVELSLTTNEEGFFDTIINLTDLAETRLTIKEKDNIIYKSVIEVNTTVEDKKNHGQKSIEEEQVHEAPDAETSKDLNKNNDSNSQKERKETSPNQNKMRTARSTASLAKSNISYENGTTYHYVDAGETLYSIANFHGVTVDELKEWNNLNNTNIIKVGDILSVDGKNIYSKISKESQSFNTTDSFLNYIAPIAQDIAEEYNIYTSVMMAQLIHESAWGKSQLAQTGNNLGGVKGDYNGNSIYTTTWEEVNGKRVTVKAEFKLYPSYRESILDNAMKIRNGTNWNPSYYNGAWVENTASHLDATEWLTGRYATDSQYSTKLNNIIKNYNLTRYDKHITISNPISSQRNIDTTAIISHNPHPIYSQPYGTASYRLIDNTSNHYGKVVEVKQEKVNDLGTWWLIYEENDKLGWVQKETLELYPVLSTTDVDYQAEITKNWSINTLPWGTTGFRQVDTGSSYYGEVVRVTQEKVTPRGTFSLVTQNGKEIGWIDKGALSLNLQSVLSTKNTSYIAKVEKGWSINTKPWGVSGYKFIEDATPYIGKNVKVIQEKTTPRSIYGLLEYNGETLGWFDTKGLEKQRVISTRDSNYIAKVEKDWSINTRPWGVEGFEYIENASPYIGKNVLVTQEKVTPRSTYVLINYNGITLGWFDKNGLEVQRVLSTEDVNYKAEVIRSWSINTAPWGTEGFKEITSGAKYLGKTVDIIQEKVTPRSTYSLISINGEEIGWIDKGALDLNPILSSTDTNYIAKIEKGWSINTKPWGVIGFEFIEDASSYVGKNVRVIQEKVTPRSTYGLLEYNGRTLGWFDTKGLDEQRVLSTRTTNYVAKINKGWSINSKPWGVNGFEFIEDATSYIGQTVTVTQEKDTPRSTYGLLELNGEILGWFDINGLEIQEVLNTRTVNYTATVEKPWSINTLPWGVNGYKLVDNGSSYLEQTVSVTQEKGTPRGTYALISIHGREIGWIDKGALNIHHVVLSTRNTNYAAKITKGWSINTKPWGVEGYKTVASGEDYFNETVEITQEKTTPRSTYALITIDGKEVGWIDTGALEKQRVLSTRVTNYVAKVEKSWSINTEPWGVEGYKFIEDASPYVGKNVEVIQEKQTPRSTYGLLTYNGTTLGWFDINGLNIQRVLSTRNTNYVAKVEKSWSLNTQPWGTNGYIFIESATPYVGELVKVVQEKDTPRSTYALLSLNGLELGWFDIKGLQISPVVYLDAGHGGTETGAVSGGVFEKDINLSVTKKVRDLLEAKGYTVIMAREDDTYLSLSHRAQEANRMGADVFVSIHQNAYNGSAHGIETFYYNESGNTNNPKANDKNRIQDSKKLAEEVQRELVRETGAYDRGVKRANFHVIRETKMPSILVEGGFLDNAKERAKLVLDSYQQKLANAITKGVEKFFSFWK